jgi:hypothetical protein
MLLHLSFDRLCGLVVRVPGYTTETYCASCEVRTEFICYVEENRPPLWSSSQSSWLQSGDVFCFLWGTNLIYICYVEDSRLPLWSSSQRFWLQIQRSSGRSSWLQIQRSVFDFRCYQIFREVVCLERGPLSLVSTIEELLGRNSSVSGLGSREYGRRDPSRWPRYTSYPQKSWH